MNIHLISIFPEIFESFLKTSLVEKAQRSDTVKFFLHNPREYTHDKHQQVDDEIYG
jgi:tRNA (guanine37-N1)-methyltransferase